jgi:hypothetical protein
MVLRTNIGDLAKAAKAIGKDVVSGAKAKMKKPVSMVREAGRTIRRNPKKSAAIGAGLAGSTGFYLYDGKRNAYEDDTSME